jgi:hypothetical protein
VPEANLEVFIIEGFLSTSLAGLRGGVQVDEEQDGKEGSEKDGQVSTELNLKGQRGGGKGLNNGVHGEDRGRQECHRDNGSSSLGEGGLGD